MDKIEIIECKRNVSTAKLQAELLLTMKASDLFQLRYESYCVYHVLLLTSARREMLAWFTGLLAYVTLNRLLFKKTMI